MRNDALRDRVDLKATIHQKMLRVIHNERNGMSPQLITDMPVKDMMQFIQQGEFADLKVP
jgi:hypothetical protein